MYCKSGKPRRSTCNKARSLLEQGKAEEALQLLAGAVHGAGFDVDFYELFGRTLLATGHKINAGRFLFLCGKRRPEYEDSMRAFINRNHDANNFRQLHSKFPESARTIWKLKRFPQEVAEELRKLGFPENIQEYFIGRARNNNKSFQ
jgi:hypothetical protein